MNWLCPALLSLSLLIAGCGGDANTASDATPPGDSGPLPDSMQAPDATPELDAGNCTSPLEDEVLQELRISLSPSLQLRPGTTLQLGLGTVECCVFLEPVDACAQWSVSPANEQSAPDAVTISGDTGYLQISPTAQDGATYTIAANVENGRRVITIDLHIYTPEASPLVGYWSEVAQLECGSGAERAPELSVGELRFGADGIINVTWTPFEVYVDYWGSYAAGSPGSELEFTITGNNYLPEDIDSSGTYSIEANGDLILHDLWLGSPYEATQPAACGHRFQR